MYILISDIKSSNPPKKRSSCLIYENDTLLNLSQELSVSNSLESFEGENNVNCSTNSELLDISLNKKGVGDAIKNGSMKNIPFNKTKKYSCKFCGKKLSKLTAHLESVHKDEQEIKVLRLIPKGKRTKGSTLSGSQRKRLDIINRIRNQGNLNIISKQGCMMILLLVGVLGKTNHLKLLPITVLVQNAKECL